MLPEEFWKLKCLHLKVLKVEKHEYIGIKGLELICAQIANNSNLLPWSCKLNVFNHGRHFMVKQVSYKVFQRVIIDWQDWQVIIDWQVILAPNGK